MKKLKIVLDNNIYSTYKKELIDFKEKYKHKIEIFLTDPNIVEMIEFEERLNIAIKIKDKLFGPPQFVVLNEINEYFNKNIFTFGKYKKIKNALYQIFFNNGCSFKELIETRLIYDKNQVDYITKEREKIKKLYLDDWKKSAAIIRPIIEKIKKEEGVNRFKILDNVKEKYILSCELFDYVMERFYIKKYFNCYYLLLYVNNTWLKKIRTLSSFMNYYLIRAENYYNQNFQNISGSDLIDLDYTVYFPLIDYFITENKKHFLNKFNDEKIKNFKEFNKMIV
ncbi:MAG: hypothetical protein N2114_03030 [Candidatus Goldbacteria bacterium]|nr:hypothetical protein [Candidatus Goldiibacteriota bacterium]